jgi:hypothetical protein
MKRIGHPEIIGPPTHPREMKMGRDDFLHWLTQLREANLGLFSYSRYPEKDDFRRSAAGGPAFVRPLHVSQQASFAGSGLSTVSGSESAVGGRVKVAHYVSGEFA